MRESAEESSSGVESAFKKIGSAVATYFAVGKIIEFGQAIVNLTATFEDSMLKVQSLSGATQEEYQKLSDAALDYGSKTAWTAKDVADAMGYMALAGFDTNQILESTSGMLSLASASGEDLATVTDILTDAMTGFGDSTDQATRYADVLATVQAKSNTTVGLLGDAFKYVSPLAGAYGYELEDVATALGIMANAGVKGSIAGTSLSTILTRLATDAGSSSTKLGALGVLTQECGVEFYNSDGSARNLSDVLKDLCDATKDFTVEQKASIAETIAGQEGQKGLLAILNQGSSAYEDLRLELTDCSGSASAMAENMESGIGGAIRSAQSAMEGFKINMVQCVSEPIEGAIRATASFITKISEAVTWLAEHESAATVLAIAIGTLTAALIAYNVAHHRAAIAATVGKAAATAFGSAMGFVTSPITLVILAIGALVAAGVLLYKNWDTVKAKALELWEKLTEVFNGIKETVADIWDGIWTVIKTVLNAMLGGIEGWINGIIDSINRLISGLNSLVSAAGSLLGLTWNIPTIKNINLPRLEEGGILEKGQVGLLEGNGAEAVVPLDQNRAWISAVARDMEAAGIGGNSQQAQRIIELLEMLIDMLPETMKDAFASMKFDVNNREFARLVKAVG